MLPAGYEAENDDSLPQAKLRKRTIQAGYILWLREQIDEDELLLLKATGLKDKALNHPVVVIDELVDDDERVEICVVWKSGILPILS